MTTINQDDVKPANSRGPLLYLVAMICLLSSFAAQPIIPDTVDSSIRLLIGGAFLIAGAICFMTARRLRAEDKRLVGRLNG